MSEQREYRTREDNQLAIESEERVRRTFERVGDPAAMFSDWVVYHARAENGETEARCEQGRALLEALDRVVGIEKIMEASGHLDEYKAD